MRRVYSIVVAAVVVSVSQAGFGAEPPNNGEAGGGAALSGAGAKATAEDLFQKGIQLIQAGKWAEAASALEESNRLDRAAGTTINLADCYEHVGKLASAWTLFKEAESQFGQRTPPDARAETARTRAEALYPRLSRLTIEVPEGVRKTPGLVVKRDGEVVGAAQFGTGIAVDPGAHVIEASAPGKVAWKGEVKIEGEKATGSITVEALKDVPPPPPKTGDPGWPWQKKAALGVAGVGVAGVIVGAIFGGDALGKHGVIGEECTGDNPRYCSAKGTDAASGLKTSATISTIGFAAGGALVAAGVVLWVVAPSAQVGSPATTKNEASVWVAPQVGPVTGVKAGVVW